MALFLFFLNLVWSGAALIYDLPAIASIPLWAWAFVIVCPLYPFLLALMWWYRLKKKTIPPFLLGFGGLASAFYGILALIFYPLLLHYDHFSWNAILQIFWVWAYAIQGWYFFLTSPPPTRIRAATCLFLATSLVIDYYTQGFNYLAISQLPDLVQKIILFLSFGILLTLFLLPRSKNKHRD